MADIGDDDRVINKRGGRLSTVTDIRRHSLMSRVMASPNSIVTAIVNCDAYHQSPLMDKSESMLYV